MAKRFLKKMVSDVRVYIFLFGLVIIIGGYVGLPEKVKSNTGEIVDHRTAFDKYIAVQDERAEGDAKREDILLDLLHAQQKANGGG